MLTCESMTLYFVMLAFTASGFGLDRGIVQFAGHPRPHGNAGLALDDDRVCQAGGAGAIQEDADERLIPIEMGRTIPLFPVAQGEPPIDPVSKLFVARNHMESLHKLPAYVKPPCVRGGLEPDSGVPAFHAIPEYPCRRTR